MNFENCKIETFIPEEYVDRLRERLNTEGVLTIGGNYDNCMSVSKVQGYWRPLSGANPFDGQVGKLSCEEECKVEFCCRSQLAKISVDVIREVHPYEVPVINVLPMLNYYQ